MMKSLLALERLTYITTIPYWHQCFYDARRSLFFVQPDDSRGGPCEPFEDIDPPAGPDSLPVAPVIHRSEPKEANKGAARQYLKQIRSEQHS